jgi:hypothetical protein
VRVRKWTASDGCGNTSAEYVQTITVQDTTAPSISDVPDATVECTTSTLPAATGGSATGSDTCGDVTISYTDGAFTAACGNTGSFVRTWKATDECGNMSTSEQTIITEDTTAPVITTCPASTSASADATCMAAVPDVTAGVVASDSCGSVTVTQTPLAGTLVGLGPHTITVKVTDACGNMSTCTTTFTVNDTTLPVITLKPSIALWPPNHKYVTLNVTDLVASVSDNCNTGLLSSVYITQVTSDEPENINSGDGNTFNDMVIASNCKSLQLRAERDGNKNGRVYTIYLKVTDAAGNIGTATAKVTVPHSQGPNGGAVEGPGPGYTVTSACP